MRRALLCIQASITGDKPAAAEAPVEEAEGEKGGQRSVMDVLVDASWLSSMPEWMPQVI